MTHDDAQELLRIALDDAEAQFRDGHWEAIDAIVNRRQKLLIAQRGTWKEFLSGLFPISHG